MYKMYQIRKLHLNEWAFGQSIKATNCLDSALSSLCQEGNTTMQKKNMAFTVYFILHLASFYMYCVLGQQDWATTEGPTTEGNLTEAVI